MSIVEPSPEAVLADRLFALSATSDCIMTAEELFVPSREGFAPMSRLILDAVTAAHPVDIESGDVVYGPRNPDETPQKNQQSHPYVFIELVDEGTVVKAFKRQDRRKGHEGQTREYYVRDDELYRVTVTTNEEVGRKIQDRSHVKVTHYSDDTKRVAVRVPRPEPHVQTYFPGGKK